MSGAVRSSAIRRLEEWHYGGEFLEKELSFVWDWLKAHPEPSFLTFLARANKDLVEEWVSSQWDNPVFISPPQCSHCDKSAMLVLPDRTPLCEECFLCL